MANPNKSDANQNQHNHKAMAAGAGAGTHRPDAETIEGVDSPESIGGERPNRSNTNSMKQEAGERLDLKGNEQPEGQNR